MEEIIPIIREFGMMGLWGVILYKVLDTISTFLVLFAIGYGIKKGWKPFTDFLRTL